MRIVILLMIAVGMIRAQSMNDISNLKQSDLDSMKNELLPAIQNELGHMEMSNLQTEDGVINRLVMDNRFPQAKDVVLKISNKVIEFKYPRLSSTLDLDFTDKLGGKTKAKINLKELTVGIRLDFTNPQKEDLDFDLSIKDFSLSSHSSVSQSAIDQSMGVGMSMF